MRTVLLVVVAVAVGLGIFLLPRIDGGSRSDSKQKDIEAVRSLVQDEIESIEKRTTRFRQHLMNLEDNTDLIEDTQYTREELACEVANTCSDLYDDLYELENDVISLRDILAVLYRAEYGSKLGLDRQEVVFREESIEAVVRQRLHKPTGAIYNIDLDSLGLLYFDSSQRIETLDDLKRCEFLQVLRVVGDRNHYWFIREKPENVPPAQVLDISSLEALVYLQQLEISDTWITDISPLSSLMNLVKLDLAYNQISDISALALLGKLTALDLSDNKITDISALENLKQLRRLNLSYNEITDISALENLKQLRRLNLSYNEIRDISVLLQLPELREVAMQGNRLYRGTVEWDLETREAVHTKSAEETVVEVLRERGVDVSWFW